VTTQLKLIIIIIIIIIARTKAQGDEGAGRILLGDNKGRGTVMLRPIRSQCVGM
jgi:hypothetical protein